jgi:AraC family transcriptional regulator
MTRSEGYGQRFTEGLRVEQASALVTRVLRTAEMVITETWCDAPAPEVTGSIRREDAYPDCLVIHEPP